MGCDSMRKDGYKLKDKYFQSFLISWFIVSIIIFSIFLFQSHLYGYTDEQTELYYLNKQYIGNITGRAGVGVNCLIFDVTPLNYTQCTNLTFYFAGEHSLREDLHEGCIIKVRWVKTRHGWFIRGVEEVRK